MKQLTKVIKKVNRKYMYVIPATHFSLKIIGANKRNPNAEKSMRDINISE